MTIIEKLNTLYEKCCNRNREEYIIDSARCHLDIYLDRLSPESIVLISKALRLATRGIVLCDSTIMSYQEYMAYTDCIVRAVCSMSTQAERLKNRFPTSYDRKVIYDIEEAINATE